MCLQRVIFQQKPFQLIVRVYYTILIFEYLMSTAGAAAAEMRDSGSKNGATAAGDGRPQLTDCGTH